MKKPCEIRTEKAFKEHDKMLLAGDGHLITSDKTMMNCTACHEEYFLPEGLEKCPICERYTLEEI